MTTEAMVKAREFFERAVCLDPHFALAHTGYAEHLFFLSNAGLADPHTVMPMMRREAEEALANEPTLSEAHAALGQVAATYDYDWSEAERRFSYAMLDPATSPWTRALCAVHYLYPRNRIDEAVKQAEQAVYDDPLHFATRTILAVCLDAAGRSSAAEYQLRQVFELAPNFLLSYHAARALYTAQERFDEALEFAEKAYIINPQPVQSVAPLAGLLARTGARARSSKLLNQIKAMPAYVSNRGMLYFCLYSGDVNGAANWAEKAIRDRVPSICSTLVSGVARDLRASVHWPKLVEMMKLPVA